MHDFAITENHVVWFDLSATLGLKSGLPFPHTRPATSTTTRHKGAAPLALFARSKQGT